ncbi:YbaN family protein [Candidatus Fermentibacteria bacterium]|nr:YbaN family protein [Candidatus Fermentibacteria bacterium]
MIHRRESLLIVAGTTCLALAVAGILLRVVPTTPFLSLAAVCYARSSRRSYHRLMTNRRLGAHLSE